MVDKDTILETCRELLPETTAFLDRLVRFESLPGYEGPAMEWVYDQFRDLADVCEKVPVPEDIVNDPDYAFTLDNRPYEGRPNVRIMLRGDGTGKSVIFNSHVDVVPPSVGQERPFDPYVKDGRMYGRGTNDDKGHIAILWTILKVMKKLGVRPKGDLIFHIVIEEETGGNGTLALVRRGEKADCCINFDSGDSWNVMTSIRGAVWFTCTVYGRAGHSGSAQTTVSALKIAIEAMNIIEEYHDDLLAETINVDPLFARMDNPMPVTFGQIKAGDWPAMSPQKAVLKGVFGFLTTPKEEVMHEIEERLRTRGSEWLRDNFEITFQYRHDMSRVDPDSPFVRLLIKCYEEMGIESEPAGMPSSSDAWFYTNQLGIPCILTGAADMLTPHTGTENIILENCAVSAAVMTLFINEWCGLRKL